MLNLARRRSHSVAVVILVISLAFIGSSAFAAPTGEEPVPPDNMPAGSTGESGTPGADQAEEAPTPEPTVDPKAAEEACKKNVAALRSDGAAALKSLSEGDRAALLSGPNGVQALTCLAIAGDDEKVCDLLQGDAQKACKEQWKLGHELKGVPKEQIKGQMMFRTCSSNSGGANCEILRQAVNSGKADKCAELEDPSRRAFCTAVATGDATKCDAVPAGPERSYCTAFATDDPSACPKEAPDCVAMARGFAALKKGGLEAFDGIDATIAAAAAGSKACNSLLDELDKGCSNLE